MNNERVRGFFEGDLDVRRILRNISLETGVPVTPDTLVLLDEIQECPRALTSLISALTVDFVSIELFITVDFVILD